MAFNPHHRTSVTLTDDRILRIFPVPPGVTQKCTLSGTVRMHPDGRHSDGRRVHADDDKEYHIWIVTPQLSAASQVPLVVRMGIAEEDGAKVEFTDEADNKRALDNLIECLLDEGIRQNINHPGVDKYHRAINLGVLPCGRDDMSALISRARSRYMRGGTPDADDDNDYEAYRGFYGDPDERGYVAHQTRRAVLDYLHGRQVRVVPRRRRHTRGRR